jgi:hypothetical protein
VQRAALIARKLECDDSLNDEAERHWGELKAPNRRRNRSDAAATGRNTTSTAKRNRIATQRTRVAAQRHGVAAAGAAVRV